MVSQVQSSARLRMLVLLVVARPRACAGSPAQTCSSRAASCLDSAAALQLRCINHTRLIRPHRHAWCLQISDQHLWHLGRNKMERDELAQEPPSIIEPLDFGEGHQLTGYELDVFRSIYVHADSLGWAVTADASVVDTTSLEESVEVAGSGRWTKGLLVQVHNLTVCTPQRPGISHLQMRLYLQIELCARAADVGLVVSTSLPTFSPSGRAGAPSSCLTLHSRSGVCNRERRHVRLTAQSCRRLYWSRLGSRTTTLRGVPPSLSPR